MPSVIEIQPLLTTSLIRARRSVTSSLMLIGGFSAGGSAPVGQGGPRAEATFAARRRRSSGPSTRSSP